MIRSLYRGVRFFVARQVGYLRLLSTLAGLQNRMAGLQSKVDDLSTAVAGLGQSSPGAAGVVETILLSTADSYFRCVLNRTPLLLPRDTMRIYRKCIQGLEDGGITVFAETPHYDWMRARLRPGDVFVDVGAASGTMALPMACQFGGDIKVVAFEPSRAANRLLRATAAANGITNLEVCDAAVADAQGVAAFTEFPQDETGHVPFLPEVSSIATAWTAETPHATKTYEVPVTTLDRHFNGRPDAASVKVVKIDVEGFEVKVLDGARAFLAAVRPALAIDIHRDPFGPGDTGPGVRRALEPLGFKFEQLGHVLTCIPDARG
jgi:FkbM family methyltransferase